MHMADPLDESWMVLRKWENTRMYAQGDASLYTKYMDTFLYTLFILFHYHTLRTNLTVPILHQVFSVNCVLLTPILV